MLKMFINKRVWLSNNKLKCNKFLQTMKESIELKTNSQISFYHSKNNSFVQVYLGLGSNLGNRFSNFQKCIKMIEERRIGRIEKTSQIYQSPCIDENNQIVKEENQFLNSVVKLETELSPHQLLVKCKEIEKEFKRKDKVKYYEAREIDIDILLYGCEVIDKGEDELNLKIPHLNMGERLFVLRPLLDIDKDLVYFERKLGKIVKVANVLEELLKEQYKINIRAEEINKHDKIAYLSKTFNIPFHNGREVTFDLSEKTLLMGVINCTPDSFSGGLLKSSDKKEDIDKIINLLLENKEYIDIMDIGGESTKPGSSAVNDEEELSRVSEIIKAIRETKGLENKIISIDTRKPFVAEECIKLGANIINDVSGFTFNNELIKIAAEYQVPYICMHCRATPDVMQKKEFTKYKENSTEEIIEEIKDLINKITKSGFIPDWNMIIDPGIGFSKLKQHNLQIINRLDMFKNIFPNVLLMAHSKKRFIQDTLKVGVDETTIGNAVIAGISITKGANIIRAHEYKQMSQAIKMTDAIIKPQ